MGRPFESRLDEPLSSYWADRFTMHTHDTYAGVPLAKFPEDLRVYEHLLWMDKPNVVIEIGTYRGGGALWFRDRLRTLHDYGAIPDYTVITVDVHTDRAREQLDDADRGWQQHITLVTGDVLDPGVPDRITEVLPDEPRCLVVEDSAHTYATTMAALAGFEQFVHPGGFLVIEDGCVDVKAMRVDAMRLASRGIGPLRRRRWPHGVLPAVNDWLADHDDFAVRRDLELYGVTCHPGGILQRQHQTQRA